MARHKGFLSDARALSTLALAFFIAGLTGLAVMFFSDSLPEWVRPGATAALIVAATTAWLGLRHLLDNSETVVAAERVKAEQAIAEERRRAGAAIEAEQAKAQEQSAAADEERSKRESAERTQAELRRWGLQLRSRIAEIAQSRGPLGSTDDVPTMILRIAMQLLEAQKGMLLSRRDGDGDGSLDLLASEGFETSPEGSRISQRFARSVIAKDETIRENEPSGDESSATPADREIENLAAIPIYVQDDFIGVVVVANKEGGFREHEDEVLLALGDHAGALLQNSRLRGDLRASYLATIRILANALEAKDPFLRGHSNDVSTYVASVAKHLDLTDRQREELVFASLLHDLGKIGISERILLKPAALSTEEYNIIKLHPKIGFRLVEQVPALSGISTAVLYHHERWDGTGYPEGLHAEDIPVAARVVAVADAFSAMTSDRPYRGRLSLEDALAELERNAGSQFDPEIVRLFCDELRKRPPTEQQSELDVALSDPQLVVRLDEDEPILGHGAHAVIDNLTLLYSHRYIYDMARAEGERAAVQGVGFSVLMAQVCDIDEINEREGYAAGDAAIKRLAQAVQRLAVTCGGTAARYGGPRVALLMPKSERSEAERCARELEAAVGGAPEIRTEIAEWKQGESGAATLLRARSALARQAAAATH